METVRQGPQWLHRGRRAQGNKTSPYLDSPKIIIKGKVSWDGYYIESSSLSPLPSIFTARWPSSPHNFFFFHLIKVLIFNGIWIEAGSQATVQLLALLCACVLHMSYRFKLYGYHVRQYLQLFSEKVVGYSLLSLFVSWWLYLFSVVFLFPVFFILLSLFAPCCLYLFPVVFICFLLSYLCPVVFICFLLSSFDSCCLYLFPVVFICFLLSIYSIPVKTRSQKIFILLSDSLGRADIQYEWIEYFPRF